MVLNPMLLFGYLFLDVILFHHFFFLQEDRLSVDEALNHPYFQETP